jgi:hypothetical protein
MQQSTRALPTLKTVVGRVQHALGNMGATPTFEKKDSKLRCRWKTRIEIRLVMTKEALTVIEITVYAFGAKQQIDVRLCGGSYCPLKEHLMTTLKIAGGFDEGEIIFVK